MIQPIVVVQGKPVSVAWQKLYDFAQQHPFITLTVEFRDGQPFLAKEIIETFKFS